jgi:hypothetical protein
MLEIIHDRRSEKKPTYFVCFETSLHMVEEALFQHPMHQPKHFFPFQ